MKRMRVGLILIGLFILTACSGKTFNGSSTGNENQLLMDYSILNQSESQSLKLTKGDKLDVDIVNASGSISAEVKSQGQCSFCENRKLSKKARLELSCLVFFSEKSFNIIDIIKTLVDFS